MGERDFPVHVQCGACGHPMSGSILEALDWGLCPRCGRSDLVFSKDLPDHTGYPARGGESLSSWQVSYGGRRRSAARAQRPPAKLPGGRGRRPGAPLRANARAQMPRSVQRPAGPAGRGQRPPAQPAPPRKSKSLIVLRLVVAGVAVLVAGVVTVVWILTKDSAPHKQVAQAESPENPPSTAQTGSTATQQSTLSAPQDDPYARHKELSRPFIEAVPDKAAALRESAEALEEATRAYYAAVEARLEELRDEKGALAKRHSSHEQELKNELQNATTTRDKISDELEALRQEQLPAARFVIAYQRLNELRDQTDEAETAWRTAAEETSRAAEKVESIDETLMDAEGDDERSALDAAYQKAVKDLEEAEKNEEEAHQTYVRLSDELTEADEEVTRARVGLSEEDPDEARIVEALGAYVETLTMLTERRAEIKRLDAEIESQQGDLKAAERVVVQKKATYDAAHDHLREIGARASRAERDYKVNGGAQRKRLAEDLHEQRTEAQRVDRRAKKAYNEARDAVQEIKRRIKDLEGEITDIRERIEEIKSEGQSKKDAIDAAVAEVARKVRPMEDKRLRDMEDAERLLDRARQIVNELEAQRAEVQQAGREATRERDALATELRRVQMSSAGGPEDPYCAGLRALADELEKLADRPYLLGPGLSTYVATSRDLRSKLEQITVEVKLPDAQAGNKVAARHDELKERAANAARQVETIAATTNTLQSRLPKNGD